MPNDFDGSDFGQAVARPGMDTRTFTSIGIVENAIGGTSPVDFSNGYPLVNVRMHPSDNAVRCRVAGAHAGVGEGHWTPVQAGDEVVVLVPSGDEREGGIIVGHMNNGVDTFPNVVAGLDVTQNDVSVQRTIPNTILEFENGWMILNDATQAQLAMDGTGNWSMQSGEGDYVRLDSGGIHCVSESNGFSIQVGGGKQSVMIDPATGTIFVNNGGGLVMIGAAGAQPTDHVATIEGVCNLIAGFMNTWALVLAAAVPIFGVGAAIAATLTPATIGGLLAGGVTLGASLGPVVTPAILGPLAAALAVPRVPQANAGLGAAGVLV
jgi:phage baseplate assembly protein gpV